MMVPAYSSPTVTSMVAQGSRMMGPACSQQARKPMRAAVLKAISLESTEWYDPSNTVHLISTMGYPARKPSSMASRTPLSTAGMRPFGMAPPLISSTNS